MGRQSVPRVKFANLKQALAKHEQPPQPKAAKPATKGNRKSLKRKATETTSASNEEEQQPSKRSRLDDDHEVETQPQTTLDTMPDFGAADQLEPSLEFQRVMRDPGHPDCGASFSEALELAMAKEVKARTSVATHADWAADEDDAEADVEDAAKGAVENKEDSAVENAAETPAETAMATAPDNKRKSNKMQISHGPLRRSGRQAAKQPDLPGPASGPESVQPKTKEAKESTAAIMPLETHSQQHPVAAPLPPTVPAPAPEPPQQPAAASPPATGPGPFRIPRVFVQPKYDLFAFRTARAIREGGQSFEDMALVTEYNRVMQGMVSSRPYRSQQSLLKVSNMTAEEYFGADYLSLSLRRQL